MKKIKVLHIAPHVGAGVGTVTFSFLRRAKENPLYEHKLCILGYADERTLEAQKEIGFQLKDKLFGNYQELLKEIALADLVLIHWWNHPMISDFLMRQPLPPSRIAIWCHISGSLAPNNLTEKILKYPDVFVFTTPLSYEVPEVLNLSTKERMALRDIWSTGGVEHLKTIRKQKHESFNIGYVGNVGHGKMHPDFLEISNRIKIPNIHFTVIGGHNHNKMAEETKTLGVADKFSFPGFVPEKEKWESLSTFDVFGYPLSSDHYGTCDQVIQEAMVVGAVPVVLNNPMESFIVKDGLTGIVAKNPKEYIRAIEKLYYDPVFRKRLSVNARRHALRRFSLKKMVSDWEKVFIQLMDTQKTPHKWNFDKPVKTISPADIFIESLGDYCGPFKAYKNAHNEEEKRAAIEKIKKLANLTNWQSETKSTVHNFKNFLPKDKFLSEWSEIMHKEQSNDKV